MTGQIIGLVLVRLLSVYLAVTALQSLFLYLPSFFGPMVPLSDWVLSLGFWLIVIATLIPALCAYRLWRNAAFFVPKQADTDESPITAAQLMYVGVSLLGLYFLVWGVVTLVRVESSLVAAVHYDTATKMMQRAPYLA